jgi:FOG: LysM repeat
VTYEVQPGDTLSGIAAKYGVNYMDIARANGIENPDLIYPGQVFTIPR